MEAGQHKQEEIKFTDGATYERFMGKWSQLVGAAFLDWIKIRPGLQWLDVGCGNGAFTEMLVQHCAPRAVEGIDPSDEQLAFARTRPLLNAARFHKADAMTLPFPDQSFDATVMPLVIFFVPDPARGIAEMTRVVRPGGHVTAYSWDMPGLGFPYASLGTEMKAMGITIPLPPSSDASRMEVLKDLWLHAGLENIETLVIKVQRTFSDFEDYWTTIQGGPSAGPKLAAMMPEARAELKSRMRTVLPIAADGSITYGAWANAIRGTKKQKEAL